MSTPEMMICDWCGKEFPADPRACVESGIDAVEELEEGDEWKGETLRTVDPDEVSEEEKTELRVAMGLSDTELKELLEKGTVAGLGAIVCLECQDEAEEATN